METIESTVPPDVLLDAEAVIESLETGRPLAPEIARRIRERSEKITQKIFQEHGLVDIAVPAIRELRGELSE